MRQILTLSLKVVLTIVLVLATKGSAIPNAYVSNETSSNLTVFDSSTNTVVVPTISLTGSIPAQIAFTLDGTKAYINMRTSDLVSVVDTATNTELYTRAVGMLPQFLAITPDGSKVYVVNENSNDISVIDTATDTVNPMTIPVGMGPYDLVFTSDGSNKAYVTNSTDGTVSVIDTTTDTVIGGPLPLGVLGGSLMSISPNSATVCVSNYSDGSVSLIDTATDTVAVALPVGGGPLGSVFSVDGTKVYVCIQTAPAAVVKVDVATVTVDATILLTSAGSQPSQITVTPNGSKLYVVNDSFSDVYVIDTATNLVTTVPVGDNQTFVIVSPDGSQAYAATAGTVVAVIDTANDTLTTTIPVGTRPVYIAFLNSLLPPINVSGFQSKDIFLTQTSLSNTITWAPPASAGIIASYQIYLDPLLTDLLAEVPATAPLIYVDEGVNTKRSTAYYIVSVDSSGNMSDPVEINIP